MNNFFKNFKFIVFVAILFSFSMLDVNADKTIENGTYVIESALNSNKVLDVQGAKTDNKTNVQLYQKNENSNQQWVIKYLNNGYYSIATNLNSNKCLDVTGERFVNFSNIQIYDCNNNSNQQFIIKDLGDGYYNIVTKVNSLHVDVDGSKTADKTNIQIYKNNGKPAQKFRFIEVVKKKKTIDNGSYVIESALNNDKVLDVQGVKTDNKTNVQLYQKSGKPNQKWTIKYLNNGYYSIATDLDSHKCLDVSGEKFANFNNIQIYDCNNNSNQQFVIKDVGDGYYSIVTKVNSLYVDVDGSKTADKTNIQIYKYNTKPAQKFKFVKIAESEKTIENGTYVIESALDSNKVLDVQGAKNDNKTNVQLYQKNGNSNQQWIIKRLDNGYYSIATNLNSKKCLDVPDEKFVNFNNIQIYDCNNNSNQQFIIKDMGDGYYSIATKVNSMYVDVDGSKTADKTNIQIYKYNTKPAQKFRFIEVVKKKRTIDDGTYVIESALDSNKVLDVQGAKTDNKTNVQLYQKSGNSNQQWIIKYLDNGYYSIKTDLDNDKCLDVSDEKFANSNNIQIYNCNNKNSQQFVIKDVGDGYYSIVTKVNSLYVDVDGSKTADKTNIQIYKYNGKLAQKFKFVKQEIMEIKTGVYKIKSKINENALVDVDKGLSLENTNVQVYQNNGKNAQIWYINKQNNGYYEIRSGLYSGLYLSTSSNNSGANVKISSKKTLWSLEYAGNSSFYIIHKDSGLYLNLNNGSAANYNNVNILTSNKSEAQKFVFEKSSINQNISTISDSYYVIKSVLKSDDGKDMLVDVDGSKTANDTNIQIYQSNGKNAQIWKIKYLKDGYYSITSALNDSTSLNLYQGKTSNGTNINLNKYSGSDYQQWKIVDDGKGEISIKSKKGNICLDIVNGKNDNFTNIQAYTCNGNNAQKFTLTNNTTQKKYNGIDVSYAQANINWNNVYNSGINFVIIRAGYGDNWTSQDDKYFMKNVEGCEKYNIPYGIYLYSYAVNLTGSTALGADSQSATSEAQHIIRLLDEIKKKGYSPTLKTSIYLDMEDASVQYLGKNKLTQITEKFCSIIENNGYGCGVYANKTWLNTYLNALNLNSNYDIWLAEWSINSSSHSVAKDSKPSYNTTNYKLWQFSDSGRISGISGNVDVDMGYDIFD